MRQLNALQNFFYVSDSSGDLIPGTAHVCAAVLAFGLMVDG